MAKNQSTYTLKIDAELGNLQKTLNEAKSSLATFMQSGNAPKGLEKAFEKINDLLGKISDRTGKPLDVKGLTSTGKDLETVQENFRAIIRLLGDFNDLSDDVKLSFLSADEQKKINDITAALKQYSGAMEEVAKKSKLLETAQKQLGKDEGVLGRAKKKVGSLENERTVAAAKLKGAEGKLSAAKGIENANPQDIAKYEAKVEELRASLGVLDKNLEEANAELTKAQGVYDASAKSVGDLEKEIKKTSGDALKSLKKEAKDLGVSLDGLNGHDAATQVQILTNRLNELKQKGLNGAKQAFDNVAKGSENAEQAVKGLSEEVKEATKATEQMNEAAAQREAFEGKIKQFLGLQGAAQVLRAALRDAVQTITELDAVMGQMAVVTDLTVGDYWDQLPEYAERASKLGVSINSAYEAATLYYQQGLKANEVTALSEQTLKMAAIARLDAADATDRMTAALRGFNMELNEANAQNIADVYSELAAITAADVDEISTAMTKTASIASSAGMEFETTAAFLSQIIETTRESAETAGTAMKTVIARFQELKKSPSEIGEIDGEIVDANAIETALRSVGVSLRDSSGQFRELDDVFLELSSKWDGLDKNTQRYIATIAAGSRQQSRFIAMMSDYKRTTELVTAANTSAGASNKQFEKTMDTLEYKVNQLKNAWHEFTMGIMNSDLVKFGVDILTKFLEVVNKITEGLGDKGVGGSLTKLMSVVTIFKIGSKIFEKLKHPLIAMFAEVVKQAGVAGEDSMKEYKAGAERVATNQKQQQTQDNKVSSAFSGKVGKASNIGMKLSGIDQFTIAGQQHSEAKRLKSIVNMDAGERMGQLRDKKSNLNEAKQKRQTLVDPKEIAKADKEIKNLENDIDDLENAESKFTKASQKGWKALNQGFSAASATLMGVGMAFGAIGSSLEAAGFEEAAETFNTMSQYASTAGAVLGIIPPILTLIQTLFPGVGAASAAAGDTAAEAGTTASAAWSIVGIIVLAVVASIAIALIAIIAIMAIIQKNSPEGKLKAAQKAAEEAAEAANKAKEAYEGLSDAFDSLSDKYKALDELTKGTKEWNEAVLETNNSVMDLIKQYPELAQFVKNTDGVLKIDFEEAGVKEVLNKAFEASIGASNIALAADINVLDKERDLERSKLQGKSELEYEKKVYTTYVDEYGRQVRVQTRQNTNLTQEQIDLYAKAYADGKLTGKGAEANLEALREEMKLSKEEFASLQENIKDSEDAILEYGRSLQVKEQQEKAMYDSMANSVVNLVDTTGKSEERIKQMFNIADGSAYQKAYDEMEATLTDDLLNIQKGETAQDFLNTIGMTQDQLDEAFAQAGYKGASYDIASRTVSYTDEEGNPATKTLENDEIRRIISTYSASDTVKKQAEYSDAYITKMSQQIARGEGEDGKSIAESFEKALLDESGDTLTKEDYENLKQLTKTDMETYFNKLPDNLKKIYGSVDKLWNEVETARNSASYLEKTGFQDVTAGAAKNLDKIKGTMGAAQATDFQNQFNTLISGLEDSQKEYFAQQIAGLASDPTNREAWDAALERLTAEGIDASEFVAEQQAALDTRYSDTYLKNMGVSDSLISQYQAASGDELKKFHATFSKWRKDYNIVNDEAAKAEHELIEKVIDAMVEGYEKQIDAQEEAYNAMAKANDQLISRISEKIDEDRAKREDDKTREELSSNRSQLSYLMMDTSGGNALSILDMEKQIAESEQAYEDSLVDQALQKLEDANAKAAEQRERQIELARQQLEAYKNSEAIAIDARNIINDAKLALEKSGSIEGTELSKLLTPENFISEFEKAQFVTELSSQLSLVVDVATPEIKEEEKTDVEEKLPINKGKKAAVAYETTNDGMTYGRIIKHKEGGLVNYTGPAWLDGTPSKPEYVLNAAQTERFFSLVDVLEGIDTKQSDTKSTGDNYFDIEINVDKLENDYDVEQVADKIRRMIYEDATYRNVNAINHIR